MSFDKLRDRARKETDESLQLLIDVRDDESAPQKDRMAAAKAISEIAYGRTEARKSEKEYTYQPTILLEMPKLDELFFRRTLIDGIQPGTEQQEEATEESQILRHAVAREEPDEADDQDL